MGATAYPFMAPAEADDAEWMPGKSRNRFAPVLTEASSWTSDRCAQASAQHVRFGHTHWPRSWYLIALELSRDLQLTDVDAAVHDLERSRFSVLATALP